MACFSKHAVGDQLCRLRVSQRRSAWAEEAEQSPEASSSTKGSKEVVLSPMEPAPAESSRIQIVLWPRSDQRDGREKSLSRMESGACLSGSAGWV